MGKLGKLLVPGIILAGLGLHNGIFAQSTPVANLGFDSNGYATTMYADGYAFVESNGHVNVFKQGSNWSPAGVLSPPVPNSDGAYSGYGSSMASSGDFIAVADVLLDEQAGAVYVYDAAGLVQSLKEPAPGPYHLFGQSVAMSGDWLVVGSPGSPVLNCYARGNVYVYHHTAAYGWQLAEQIDGCARGGLQFGNSVAAIATNQGVGIFVGDPQDARNTGGVVYTFQVGFTLNGFSVAGLQVLSPPDGETLSNQSIFYKFGYALAANTEGTLVVGAPNATGCVEDVCKGRAYVFTPELVGPNDYSLEYRGKMEAPGNDLNDFFGYEVAISNSNLIAVAGYSYDNYAGIVTVYGPNSSAKGGGLLETIDSCDYRTVGFSLSFAGNQLIVSTASDAVIFNINVPHGCA